MGLASGEAVGETESRPDRRGPAPAGPPLRAGRPDAADRRVAIVCPMANEASTAERFVRALLATAGEVFDEACLIVVLDRASTDGTRALLEALAAWEPRLRVVWAPENRSVVDAYRRAYAEGLATGLPWILEIDAGFSHDPGDLRRFAPAMTAETDCVFGSRFCPGGRITDSPLRRRLISWGGTKLTNLLIGTRLRDMTSGYQLFRRAALERILARGLRSKGPFFQTEMKIHARSMRVREVPIHYRSASHGVGRRALGDSLARLAELTLARLAGTL